jgi:hypothetical protein
MGYACALSIAMMTVLKCPAVRNNRGPAPDDILLSEFPKDHDSD